MSMERTIARVMEAEGIAYMQARRVVMDRQAVERLGRRSPPWAIERTFQ